MGAYLAKPVTEKVPVLACSPPPPPPCLPKPTCARCGIPVSVINVTPHTRILQELESGENDSYLYGVCAMQGWRTEMVRCMQLRASWQPMASRPSALDTPQLECTWACACPASSTTFCCCDCDV